MNNASHFTRLVVILVGLFGSPHGHCFCSSEGKPSDQFLVADTAERNAASESRYGPCGELLRVTGPMARANPFRFSTKHQDHETDLLYHRYRYYNASTGRWLSRDPIAERRV
jgi:RHS repeat-associated protein